MLHRTSICAAAVLILISGVAVARAVDGPKARTLSAPAAHELSSASSRHRNLQTRPVSRTYPEPSRPLGGTVGEDNYQYFHQACCL
jgi:hypothetical protein